MGYSCPFIAHLYSRPFRVPPWTLEFFLWEAEALRISFSDVAWVALRCV